jgi:4-aminobutyrate aminotransferase-like enzyme
MIKHGIVYNPATDYRFDLAKAEGSYLWDKGGKRYIDFSSGWNTTNLGWNNKEVNASISEAAMQNVYAPMWAADDTQISYAEELLACFPEPLNAVCRATGGTEANELALKIARAVTGRKKFIGFAHTYHGQSFGTLALGYIPDYVGAIAPLVPEYIQLDYPGDSLDEFLHILEQHLKTNQIAAVFTEPGLITGWGSMLMAPAGYLSAVRKLTQKYGTLLIVDEVGTGFSRTGKLFAIGHESVVPDIVTLAKGISNGAVPIGAVVTSQKLVEDHIGEFKPTSTFGWTPLACSAALTTLRIHKRNKVWQEAARKGELAKNFLTEQLEEGKHYTDLRGLGLELAFNVPDLKRDGEHNDDLSTEIVNRSFENGLHLADAGGCIQIMPPLTIDDATLQQGLAILVDTLRSL